MQHYEGKNHGSKKNSAGAKAENEQKKAAPRKDRRIEALQLQGVQELAGNSAKKTAPHFIDNRPEVKQMKKIQELVSYNQRIEHPAIQRKIIIRDTERPKKKGDDKAIEAAGADSYLRYYNDEAEIKKHLVTKEPVGFGLIRSRALWYRIPQLEKEVFFVFGEHHNAITGQQIYNESNIKKPLLSEEPPGVNAQNYIENIEQRANDSGVAVALDENCSKLFRAFEIAISSPTTAFPAKGIPKDEKLRMETPNIGEELYARETLHGSYRLITREDDGTPAWWTQPEEPKDSDTQAPQQYTAPVADAILELFTKVFDIDNLNGPAKNSWEYLSKKEWEAPQDAEANKEKLTEAIGILGTLVKRKVTSDYELHIDGEVKGAKDAGGLKKSDHFRDEYMLAGIKTGHKTGKYALATIGAGHLTRIQNRLDGIPFMTTDGLFKDHGKLAIQPNPFRNWLDLAPPALTASTSVYLTKKSGYQALKENLKIYTKNLETRADLVEKLLKQAEDLIAAKEKTWKTHDKKKDRLDQINALIAYLRKGADLKSAWARTMI